MHASIIAAYNGDQVSSQAVWRQGQGWLVPLESLEHGMTVWVEHSGSKRLIDNGHQGRISMRIDKPSEDIVWPEVLMRLDGGRRAATAPAA